MNTHQIALRTREQMASFLGNLSRHVRQKTARRFVGEALYGITARKSLRLSEIARALNESIALIKTENRLSRQAQRPGLEDKLHDFVIAKSAHRVQHKTLLIIDPSDIVKPHAEKMEHLTRVRDGSSGGFGDGYWLCQVIAAECGGHQITPLVNHLWSHAAPGHKSENNEVLSCVRRVTDQVASRGIWVMDRGGDRMSIMKHLLLENRRFLIRMVGNRHLLYKGTKILAEDLAKSCPTPFAETIVKQRKDGAEEFLRLEFGMMGVRLPGFENKPLCMVVLKGFAGGPIMTLTTEPLKNSRRSLQWALDAYLTRWRIEETLRYAKQSFKLEDVRVLGYQSLRTMMALALVAMSFAMLWMGQREKLAVLARRMHAAAKRFYGIPDFHFYAISDGLAEILSKMTKRVFARSPKLPPNPQLDMLKLWSG